MLALLLWAVTDLQRFVLFAVLGTMIVPYALVRPGGSQVAMADILLLVALGAWLIAGSVRAAPGPMLASNRVLWPALLFVAINAESLMWSVSPEDTVQFTIQLIEIVIIFPLVFASLPRSTDVIRRGLIVFITLTCVLAVIYVPIAPGELPGGVGKNSVGSFLAAGWVMAYALCLAERRRGAKGWLGAACLIEFVGLFASASRGAIIGALIAVVVVAMLFGRGRLITITVVATAVFGFIAIHGTGSGIQTDTVGSYDSAVVRTYSFRHAVAKIQQEPILGSGGGTYSDYIPQLGIGLPDPNNMFLLTWAEIGLIGLLALGFLLYRAGALLLAVSKLPAHAAVPAVAAGCTSLATLVHFQFDVTWTRGTASLVFAMIGVMLAAQRLAAASAVEPALDRTRTQASTSVDARAGVA